MKISRYLHIEYKLVKFMLSSAGFIHYIVEAITHQDSHLFANLRRQSAAKAINHKAILL